MGGDYNYNMNVFLIGSNLLKLYESINNSTDLRKIKKYWALKCFESVNLSNNIKLIFDEMDKNHKIGNNNFNPVLIVKIKDLSACEIDLILKRMKKIYYYIIPLILLIEDSNSYDLRLEEFREKIDKRLSRLIFIQK